MYIYIYVYKYIYKCIYKYHIFVYAERRAVQLSLSVSQDSKRLVGHYARSMASWARFLGVGKNKKRLQRSTILTW